MQEFLHPADAERYAQELEKQQQEEKPFVSPQIDLRTINDRLKNVRKPRADEEAWGEV